MKTAHRIGLGIVILGIGGLALFVTLLAKHGLRDIAEAFARAGWGLLAIMAFHAVTLFVDSLSWRALIPREQRPSIWRLFYIHWIGDAVSAMLPVAQVGGEVVRVRLVAVHKVPMATATSSVLVGMTLSVATQVFFTLSGLTVLVVLTGSGSNGGLTRTVILASVLGILAVGGFYAVQRAGIFKVLAKIINHVAREKAWAGLIPSGEALDRDIRACYARRAAVLESSMWLMVTWLAGAVEVWIALKALGIHATFAHAYALESVSQGIRSAFFLVPGALGFQEGGYLVVGRLFGISAPNALALSLIHRAREVFYGIPGLVAWQWTEGKRLWTPRTTRPAEALVSTAPPKAP